MKRHLPNLRWPSSIGSNSVRIGLSLAIGILTWMLVTWTQNPFREDWLPDSVPIEVQHVPSGLIEVGSPGAVRIRIRASQDAWSSVKPSDFKATADLAQMAAGIHSADVRAETSGQYQIVDWDPRQLTVRLEPLTQRTLPVVLHLTGKLGDGYILSGQAVQPAQVTISGQEQLSTSVVEVAVGATLDGLKGDDTETATPMLVNDKGQVVSGLQIDPPTVRISLAIERQVTTKTVPIELSTSGQPAQGFVLNGLTIDPTTATITGVPSDLAKVDALQLPALSLDNATASIQQTVKLPQLSGISIAGSSDVKITASVIALRASEAMPTSLSVQGLAAGMEAQLANPIVKVTLTGPAPILAVLKSTDLTASIDVSGLTAGSHDVPVKVSGPANVTLGGASPDHVTVVVGPAQTLTVSSPSASPVASSSSPTSSVPGTVTSQSPSPSASGARSSIAATPAH